MVTTLLNTIEDTPAREICAAHEDAPEKLLEIFHDVQARAGYISDAAVRTIAHALNLSRAEVHGTASFYHDFRRSPQTAQTVIQICRAEACQASGCGELIENAEAHYGTKLDADSETVALKSVFCLGNCALGPAVLHEKRLYGRATLDTLKSITEPAQ